jgi:hypothetical protein
MANFDKLLKIRYTKLTTPGCIAARKSNFLKLANKPTIGGESISIPVTLDGPQGFSYSLAAAQVNSAQTARGGSFHDAFLVAPGDYHGSVKFTAKQHALGKTDADAYAKVMINELDNAFVNFGSISARKLFGPVGGSIGRILATNGGGTAGELTLTIAGDAGNFTPGMILQAADGTGVGAPTNVRAALGYVIAVDMSNSGGLGHVTLSATSGGSLGLPASWANNDYLFRNGDVGAIDLQDKQIRSLQSWITLATATDTFAGVNRSQHGALSGFRCSTNDVAGLSITEKIQLLVATGNSQYGSMPDTIVLGPFTYQQLCSEAQTYGTMAFGKDATIGVSYVTVMTVAGEVKVVSDAHCLEADIWAFTMNKVVLANASGWPGLSDADSNQLLRSATEAAYEIRYECFSNVHVTEPWNHGRAPN